MTLILRALKNRKVVLFDCALMEDDPSLPKRTVTEQTMRLWSQLDQPPFLNVKGERVQFGTQIKNFYCNRSISTVPCRFQKDVDPVCLFNRPVGKWTPVTPGEQTAAKSPPRKRKASTRLPSNQGKETILPIPSAHYTIPKRSKTIPQEEPRMVSVLCPLLTSAPRSPSPEVMPPPSPSEYLNRPIPTNQSPLAKCMAQPPLQQHVSSHEQFTAESMHVEDINALLQDNYVSASGSPSTPDLFDPQWDPEEPMLYNKRDDPLGLKATQDWDSSDFTFPPTPSLHTPIPTDLASVQHHSPFHFQCFSPLS